MKDPIYDGRRDLYQWDLNRYVETSAAYIEWDGIDGRTVGDGARVAIPNILLQTAGEISGYAEYVDSDGQYTRRRLIFKVIARPQPVDYVYTETEIQTVQSMIDASVQIETERAEAVEQTKVGYADYIDSYLCLYSDDTKAVLIAKILIEGGGSGGGITESRCREIIASYGFAVASDFYSKTEIDTKLSKKQDVISDLDAIRSGAKAGATALQSVPSTYRTAAAQDVIDATKQGKIDDLDTIRSGAAAGAKALQEVPDTYRTSAAQDVIDESIKSELASEVERAKAAENDIKNTRVGYSEVVDNQLLMYSDSTKSNLLATLDLPSGGAVDDVTVNGTTIVSDGVAAIPLANGGGSTGTFGLVKQKSADYYSGITINNGQIECDFERQGSSEAMFLLRARNSSYNIPLLAKAFDLAVKHAMCDEPTDGGAGNVYGKALTWTSSEQAAAQERIGIYLITSEEYGLITTPSDSCLYIITDAKHIYVGSTQIM